MRVTIFREVNELELGKAMRALKWGPRVVYTGHSENNLFPIPFLHNYDDVVVLINEHFLYYGMLRKESEFEFKDQGRAIWLRSSLLAGEYLTICRDSGEPV